MASSKRKKKSIRMSASQQRSLKAQKLTAHIKKSASKSLLELRQKAYG